MVKSSTVTFGITKNGFFYYFTKVRGSDRAQGMYWGIHKITFNYMVSYLVDEFVGESVMTRSE